MRNSWLRTLPAQSRWTPELAASAFSARRSALLTMLLLPGRFHTFIAAVLLSAPAVAWSASFNEFVDGDLSGDAMSPTPLVLDAGANLLVAESSSEDNDLLKIAVPANFTLNSLVVEFHDDSNPIFVGLQAGPIWTAGMDSDIDPTLMLGWTEFPSTPGQPHTGQDILDDIGLGAGASGFTPPLLGGTYTFLFSAESTANRFALNFQVSSLNSTLAGDFNGDRVVDGLDLARWRQDFQVNGDSDADGDQDSDGADLLAWQRNLGFRTMAPVLSVPEPDGLLQVIAATIGVAILRYSALFARCEMPSAAIA